MKKKGFTLIELLAVIVILAIIALIATPIILNMINDAKKSAAKDSAYGYIEAIEYQNSISQLDSTKYTAITENDVVSINEKINLKGTKPTKGTVTITNGRVTSADLCINGFNIHYNGTLAEVLSGKCDSNGGTSGSGSNGGTSGSGSTTNKVYANGTAIYYNPVTGAKCSNYTESNSVTGVNSGCMKFYTFNDEGENATTVNMILDHNTTAKVAWNKSENNNDGMKEVQEALDSDTANWKQKARLIDADEIAEITGAKTTLQWSSDKNYAATPQIGTTISQYYLDGKDGSDSIWQTQVAKGKGTSKYAWLYDYTDTCESNGGNFTDKSTSGYWTKTKIMNNQVYAFCVFGDGRFSFYKVDLEYLVGVRPVITVEKSLIS